MHPNAMHPPARVLQPPGAGCRGWPPGAPAPCSCCCLPTSHRARAESTAQQCPRCPLSGLSTSRAGTDTICGIYPGRQTNPQVQHLAAYTSPNPSIFCHISSRAELISKRSILNPQMQPLTSSCQRSPPVYMRCIWCTAAPGLQPLWLWGSEERRVQGAGGAMPTGGTCSHGQQQGRCCEHLCYSRRA